MLPRRTLFSDTLVGSFFVPSSLLLSQALELFFLVWEEERGYLTDLLIPGK